MRDGKTGDVAITPRSQSEVLQVAAACVSNVAMIRAVTLEETPQVVELHSTPIQKVHHANDINGVVAALWRRSR